MSAVVADPSLSPVLRLHRNDDVVIARRQLVSGTPIAAEEVTVAGLVPAGHKLAARAIARGAPVRRYDQIIGFATRDIRPGEHVHLHNLGIGEEHGANTGKAARDYAYCADARPTAYARETRTFQGIVRADGRVATRNYIGILSTVNCSATVVRAIADQFRRDLFPARLAPYPAVDGVVALTHGTGCGMDMGESMTVLRRTLGGYARHPNFGAVLVVGLGCEANQIAALLGAEGLVESDRLRTYNLQEVGGTAKAIERGVAIVNEMLPAVGFVSRREVPAGHLVVGLQCGGSDGYSGITANPALGNAVDRLVAHGGTAILSETQKFIVLAGHITDALITIVGGPTWNKLSDADRKTFEAVLKEAAARATGEIVEIEKKLGAEFEKRGKTVVKVDRTPFRNAVVKLHNGPDATWDKATYDKLQALK